MSLPKMYQIFLREMHSDNASVNSIEEFRKANSMISWTSILYPQTGDSILHVCARLNKWELINYILLEWPPRNVDFKNKDCKTALHEAAQFSNIESVELLLYFGADVDALKRADWTPLMLACTKLGQRSFAVVKHLLDKNASTNVCNKDGWLPLHLACRSGDVSIVNELVERNPQTSNKITSNGKTVLHIASLHGHVDVVRLLLEKTTVSVESVDKCGNTPLHEAVCSGNTALVDLLIEKGAQCNSTNNVGLSCLHIAAAQGLEDMVSYLITHIKIDPNIRTEKGITALHCAARNRKCDVMESLISLGADEQLKDLHGRLATDYVQLS